MAKKQEAAKPAGNPQAAPGDQPDPQQLQLYVPPELDYSYRDMFSLFVGPEEVIIELGNRHRSAANRGTISNRIVLSVPNAFRLQQALAQSLTNMRDKITAQQAENANAAKSDG